MSSLVAHASVWDLFSGLLGEVLIERGLEIADETELYLVNLLSDFVRAEKLFPDENEGKRSHEPLALLYHKALTQRRDERIKTLRRLGDLSLYVAGFFGPSLREKVVGAEYYIQMGGSAYGHVSELVKGGGFAFAYRELGGRFRDFVEVLGEIAARAMAQAGPEGLLKLYETWARCPNGNLEKVLGSSGVFVSGRSSLPN